MTRHQFDALMKDASPTVQRNGKGAILRSYEGKSRLDQDNIPDTVSSMRPPANLDIEAVHASYKATASVHKTGVEFGVTGETVRKALRKAGKPINRGAWSEAEESSLRALYTEAQAGGLIGRKEIAETLGRSQNAIACKAEELGITVDRGKQSRTPDCRKKLSASQKIRSEQPGERERRSLKSTAWHSKNEHPRGFLGGKHTQEAKDSMSSKQIGKKRAPESVMKMLKTKEQRYRKTGPVNYGRGSWKAAWREVGGVRFFARSKWEANYGRYLEFLKARGDIIAWEHEPETFWFEKIRRGVRSYLPDFRVTLKTGSVEYHEVKGWMDARSKTKIKRMAKYHPAIVLLIKDGSWFKANARTLSGIIAGWE